MGSKEDLRRLIDLMDDRWVDEVVDYIRWLQRDADTLTPDEWQRVQRGERELAQGDGGTSRIGATNTMYEIILSRHAARYLARLDRMAQLRIVDRLEQLTENPLGSFTKPLTNAEGPRSGRVGS
jgi:hypothetical protein